MRAWFSRSDFTSTMISSFSFLYLRSCARRQRLVLQPVLDVLLLQAAQLLVLVGDLVEGLDHLRLQLGLDGRERHRVLELVVVHVGFGGGLGRILLLAVGAGAPAGPRGTGSRAGGAAGGATC